MAYQGRIQHLSNQTLRLIALCGQICANKRGYRRLLLQAKEVAQEMAIELNMKEGLFRCRIAEFTTYDDACRQLAIAVGRLAKVFEALDHLEAYPYRENTEQSIREILNL